MKIWSPKILTALPAPLLTALHRDCCRVRGSGWGKATTAGNKWLWNYTIRDFVDYHKIVISEMESRGWNPDPQWKDEDYRGKYTPPHRYLWLTHSRIASKKRGFKPPILREFTKKYVDNDRKDLLRWFKNHIRYLGS